MERINFKPDLVSEAVAADASLVIRFGCIIHFRKKKKKSWKRFHDVV